MNFSKLINKLFHRSRPLGQYAGRYKTRDINYGPSTAITYRMGAGYPGDVNRTHPASIEPCLVDAAAPPTAYGSAVVVDATTQGVRKMAAGDSGLDAIYGVLVRPYPISQLQSSVDGAPAALGAATPPASGVVDVIRHGYVVVKVVGAPVKGSRVFVWVAADNGAHVQGGFETVNSAGNTIELDEKSYYNGAPDANGYVELAFNI